MALHQSLTPERWLRFPLREQLLMVGTELRRFSHWASAGDTDAAARAADRVVELLNFTVAASGPGRRRRELCRARELLLGAFRSADALQDVRAVTRALIGEL